MSNPNTLILALVAPFVLTGAIAWGKPAAVTAPPLPSAYHASKTFTLNANGKDVPVIEFSEQYDYAVCSISDGTCKLDVTRSDGKTIKNHSVSPMKLALKDAATKSALSFTVAKPEYLIVAIDDLRKLVIAIDPEETAKPQASGPGIFNVTAAPYSADPTGAAMSTDAIQRAIDDASKDPRNNGIVFVSNGLYHVSELKLPSNTSLYLDSGAVIQIRGTKSDLKARYHKKSQNRDGTWLIYTADGATNVKVYGRGTIDGDGLRMEHEQNLTDHILVPLNCSNFVLDGPVLRDSGLWGTVVANSRNVTIKNSKHFNRLNMGEDDCVDICNSQDVLVERSIAISLDDPYSSKTWAPDTDLTRQWPGDFAGNRNVTFSDCLAWTHIFAFKVGAGVWRDQENITVRDCVVYDSAHAIGISNSYGSKDVRNVLFDSIDVERNTMTNLGRSWARFVIDPRKPDGGDGGNIYNVRVSNIRVRDAGTDAIPVNGLSDEKRIEGISFDRIYMPGQKAAASNLGEIGVKETKFAREIGISNAAGAEKSGGRAEAK